MQLLRSFFKKAAEKPAFTQLLRRAAFNFGKGFPVNNNVLILSLIKKRKVPKNIKYFTLLLSPTIYNFPR